ncbi:MAG: LysR family transcriptional regulator [Myxococcales bacterium]
MTDFDVRAINLNLLPALEALLAEGSVSGAARRTHVSQSAMSHSLARLRELFGDPLFVASGGRLHRTQLAERLARELSLALDQLGQALSPPEPFVAATARRTFRLATLDYFEFTALPDVLSYLATHAPGVSLELERFSPSSLPALVAGEIDLALIGQTQALPQSGLCRALLYEDPFAVLVRADHPRIGRRLDLEAYLELGHVLVSVEGRRDGAVDRALQKLGHTRRVALRVPNFMSAPLALLRTDYVCTIASGVARRAEELFGLRVLKPPLALPSAGVSAVWSRRREDDAGARWFRELFLHGKALSPHGRRLLLAYKKAASVPDAS